MPTVENTGTYVKRYNFWNPATWTIPSLYWDTFSQEQRIHAICRQLSKVIQYADYLGVNTDDIAARLKAIEDGQLDDFIVAKIEEWFEENQPEIIDAIEALQAQTADLEGIIPSTDFDNVNTVKKYIDDADSTLQSGIDSISEIIPSTDFDNVNTVKKYIDDADSTLQGSIDTINGDIADINDFIDSQFGGKTISPLLIGIDHHAGSSGANPQFPCVCQHGHSYYGFFTQNNVSNTTNPVIYNDVTKSITRATDSINGHANSCCYIDSLNLVYCSYEFKVAVYDPSTMDFMYYIDCTKRVYGISYDSVAQKLYIMTDVYENDNELTICEVNPSDMTILDSNIINVSIFNGFTVQDMAVNNGKAHISLPNGFVAIVDIDSTNIIGTYTISNIDAGNTRLMGEVEGFEFDEKNRLVCAFNFNVESFGVIGFTCLLNHSGYIPQYTWLGQTRTIDYSSADNQLDTWNNLPNRISTLLELGTLRSESVARISCSGTLPSTVYWRMPILKSCEIYVNSGCTLTEKSFIVSCDTLNLINQGTIEFKNEAGQPLAAIVMGTYDNGQLTINNYATITHDNDTTHPLITLGYNKRPCVIGNNANSAITIDTPSRIADANTIYLGGSFKINSTSA